MKHRVGGRRFGRPTDQRLAMYKNLVTDVLRYEKVITTEAKAKEIQAMVEKTDHPGCAAARFTTAGWPCSASD